MQVYQGMDIGTAKATAAEQRKIRHHLLDIIPHTRSFSVFQYRRRALAAIRDIVRRRKLPILTGGSGLYIRALLRGIERTPAPAASFRRGLEKEAALSGLRVLYDRLLKLDPARASRIKPGDQRRIIRALEIHEHRDDGGTRPPLPSLETLGFRVLVLGVSRERSELYERIHKRVDAMFRAGLVREVKRLLRLGHFSKTSGQALGYKEMIHYLQIGRAELGPELRDLIKKNTRHFAKRQLTWFRREPEIQWFSWTQGVSALKAAKEILGKYSDFS